jgi:hypothetical protein
MRDGDDRPATVAIREPLMRRLHPRKERGPTLSARSEGAVWCALGIERAIPGTIRVPGQAIRLTRTHFAQIVVDLDRRGWQDRHEDLSSLVRPQHWTAQQGLTVAQFSRRAQPVCQSACLPVAVLSEAPTAADIGDETLYGMH